MSAQHPSIARALGPVRSTLERALSGGRAARLLVACSGGADSVALVGLCARLRRSLSFELVIGHVDHGLREESASEADLVSHLAQGLGLPFESTRLQLEAGAGLPARARVARRQALLDQATRMDAGLIALGHTATDQTETILMHLVRGAGLDGIAAMPSVDPPWIRPLLTLDRERVREVAERLGHAFVDDPTNADPRHFRAWIRGHLLPRFRAENPEVASAFAAAASQARDAEDALTDLAERECAARSHEGGRFGLLDFDQVPRAVRTRALRAMCARGGVDLSALPHRVIDAIDATVVAQAQARRPPRSGPGVQRRQWDLHPNRCLIVEKDEIFVVTNEVSNH